MTIRPETVAFVDAVEKFANRRFRFRHEVTIIIELAEAHKMNQAFQDITFLAKFVSNAYHILKRTGMDSEETQKLSVQFKENLEKTSTLLRTLIQKAPEEEKRTLAHRFLSPSQDGMTTLLSLLYELSWVKNYLLDTKQHC